MDVVDDKVRLRWRHRLHNYLGFPDGIAAGELRMIGRRQARRYGARFYIGLVTSAAREGERFRLRAEASPTRPTGAAGVPDDSERETLATSECIEADRPLEMLARSVVLATGVRGHFPEFPGRDACVGVSLFWCIHCDGYESIDRTVAVVGHDDEAVQTALDLLDFTPHVTLVAGRTEGFSVGPARLGDVSRSAIAIHPCAVAEYRHDDGHIRSLVLADTASTSLPVEQVYTIQRTTATNALARMLGVGLNEIGQIDVDSNQQTNVPGVFAAGDVTSPHDHQFSAAVHEGNQAACAANYFLYRPEQKAAAE